MKRLFPHWVLLSAFALLPLRSLQALSPPSDPDADPTKNWAVDFETGALWRASNSTFQNYTVLPQMLSLRSPAHLRLDLGEGELTVRARFTLLAEAIPEGPESVYLGFSASPSIEYWFNRSNHDTCLYASVGGGVGWINSTDIPGGQGQDFTLNWFATAGLRHYFTDRFALNAGVLFQHWSNGGATDPNPGLDAVGPVIGMTWHF
jgi:hypothetical protein